MTEPDTGRPADSSSSCSSCHSPNPGEHDDQPWWQRPTVSIAAGAVLLGAGVGAEILDTGYLPALFLLLASAAVAGYPVIAGAMTDLVHRQFGMNLLITVAAVGAFLIGHGEEGATVMVLYAVAEFLENYAEQRSEASIGQMVSLAPETATVIRGPEEVVIPVEAVMIDETVVIRPGGKIPLDGTVITGASTVNQAAITGEGMPILKEAGSQVFAGTINLEGYLQVRVDRRYSESTLARIIATVEAAQHRQSSTERFIDRFAAIYTPVVIGGAIVVALIPPLIGWLDWSTSIYRALMLLVVACPCALAISAPVTMVSGITAAARHGVLIRGRDHLEAVGKARTVVFDKTGTLTSGTPTVAVIVPSAGHDRDEVLRIAASLEDRSAHPLAAAVLRAAGTGRDEVTDFTSITGSGVIGTIDGERYVAGSHALFTVDAFPADQVKSLEKDGLTVIAVGTEGRVYGLIGFADQVRESAREVVTTLREQGIRTVMLTGDNESTAAAVAARLGIDQYRAALLPEEKVAWIQENCREPGVVMVGDGVNDAPALAEATVGIAMGGTGSDLAIQTADIVLMDGSISKVAWLVLLSKRTMRVLYQNVILSVLVKTSFALLAVQGLITLWMAVGIGDMGLSLLVILNGLRVNHRRKIVG